MNERDFVFWLDGFMDDIFNPTRSSPKEDNNSTNELLIRIYVELNSVKKNLKHN